MTNKNTKLGGTDWVEGKGIVVPAADLNDTFNALVSKIRNW